MRAALGMQAAMAEVNDDLPPGVDFAPARGDQHGRGAGRRGRRELHRDGRHRERGVAAPERGPARQRDRGRADHARNPRSGGLRGARAARAEGQGRAGARLGGAEPHGRAQRGPARARQRVAARGTRQRAGDARDALRARGAGGLTPPGQPGRRGRRGQVAPAARVRARARRALDRADGAHRALPPVRLGHRLLGPGRGAPRGVRDRGLGLGRGGMAQAVDLRGRALRQRWTAQRAGRARGRADRPAARNRGAAGARPVRATIRSACARRSSRPCGWASRRWPAGVRSCSRSRTSTGPTTACSTRSSTWPSGCARRSCSSASRATSCSTGVPAGGRGAAPPRSCSSTRWPTSTPTSWWPR